MTQTEKSNQLTANTESRKHKRVSLTSKQVVHSKLSTIPVSDLKFFKVKLHLSILRLKKRNSLWFIWHNCK